MSGLSPGERVERVRMALAEAGYPDARYLPDIGPVGSWEGVDDPAVLWRAFAVAIPDLVTRCWPCFEAIADNPYADGGTCTHDPLTSPWPEVAR